MLEHATCRAVQPERRGDVGGLAGSSGGAGVPAPGPGGRHARGGGGPGCSAVGRQLGGGSGRGRSLSSKECEKEAFDGFFVVTHTNTYVHK